MSFIGGELSNLKPSRRKRRSRTPSRWLKKNRSLCSRTLSRASLFCPSLTSTKKKKSRLLAFLKTCSKSTASFATKFLLPSSPLYWHVWTVSMLPQRPIWKDCRQWVLTAPGRKRRPNPVRMWQRSCQMWPLWPRKSPILMRMKTSCRSDDSIIIVLHEKNAASIWSMNQSICVYSKLIALAILQKLITN